MSPDILERGSLYFTNISMNLSELRTSPSPGHVALSQNVEFPDIRNLRRTTFVLFVTNPERLNHVFLVTREQADCQRRKKTPTV